MNQPGLPVAASTKELPATDVQSQLDISTAVEEARLALLALDVSDSIVTTQTLLKMHVLKKRHCFFNDNHLPFF